jgi:hypothetical protein
MKARLIILVGLAVAGCDDPGFRGVPDVRVATDAEVAQCRLKSTITNEPGLYGPVVGSEAAKYARNKVLETARSDGANTVVFDPVIPGEPVYLLRARAYSC